VVISADILGHLQSLPCVTIPCCSCSCSSATHFENKKMDEKTASVIVGVRCRDLTPAEAARAERKSWVASPEDNRSESFPVAMTTPTIMSFIKGQDG